jgi:hypothetical protein
VNAAMTEIPTLVLNDGMRLENSECGYANHMLWCYVKDYTLAEVFSAFSNPEKTEEIQFLYGDTEEIYIGFTELNLIRKSEFTVDVRLTGEDTKIIHKRTDGKDGET